MLVCSSKIMEKHKHHNVFAMNKLYKILNGVAIVVTITINYISNTGIFNQETMSTISGNYRNLFTPAGFAFSIWGIIYLGLLAFTVY